VKTTTGTRSSNTITFLGTSDGLPSADRQHAALLLRLAGQTILLDAGEPCSHTLKRLGVDFNSLDAVVISHTHSDHIAGLPMLLQSMWLEQRTRPLPVWLPRQAIPAFQRWMLACYLFPSKFDFKIRWHALADKKAIKSGEVALRAFRNSHLDRTRAMFARRYPTLGFDAFSFLLEAAGKRIAYSSDLGSVDDLTPLCVKPLDLLIVELAHFHPDRLVEFLRDRPVTHPVITHMGRPVRAKLPAVKRCLRRLAHTRVSFPTDGACIQF
jgi:ribonuclease BN (tRNA processing enzyme)